MRAPTRKAREISIMAFVLVISIGFLVPKAAAQSDKYSKMAPVDQCVIGAYTCQFYVEKLSDQ
jgi:hypothetical protein